MEDVWVLGAVGDVFINRPEPKEALDRVAPILSAVDLLFGNCEGVFTANPHYAPTAGFRLVARPENADPLFDSGFDVLSCANNHTVDAGHEALTEMLDAFRKRGVAAIGAGRDAAEAAKEAMINVGAATVAFLAYTSVFQAGYKARGNVPGVAAIQIHTHYYVPSDGYARVEPGCMPEVVTFPYPEDERALADAIAAAASRADVVIVSFHWGESTKPALLTDYERRLGRLAVDAGAHLVLGHHHHILRGVEIYQDRLIFYGLGHFAFDMPGMEALSPEQIQKWRRRFGDYVICPREGYPLLPFHPDTRMTMIAVCEFHGRSIGRAGFIPCLINPANQPVPLMLDSNEGQRIIKYMQSISDDANLRTQYLAGDFAVGGFQAVTVAPR